MLAGKISAGDAAALFLNPEGSATCPAAEVLVGGVSVPDTAGVLRLASDRGSVDVVRAASVCAPVVAVGVASPR